MVGFSTVVVTVCTCATCRYFYRDIELENCVDLGTLPDNWEIRHTASGRQYFVNHVDRTTQFTGKDILVLHMIVHTLLVLCVCVIEFTFLVDVLLCCIVHVCDCTM